MNQLTQLLADLVAIDSVNPDLVAGGAGENNVAQFIAGWLREHGLQVQVDEVQPNRPNVIAIAKGSGGGKTLMLNGHTDTVGVGGMQQPHTPIHKDGKLFGRGAYDMKCGLTAGMVAICQAQRMNLRGDVVFTAVMDEEYAGLGTLDIAKKYKADAAIVAEPTEMQLVVAHKGFVWFELETQGVAAHGSRPDLGVDAIVKMGKVLVELERLGGWLAAHPTHALLNAGSLHASLISGGQELSSYPARCVLHIERRTVPGETPEIAEQQLRDMLHRLAADDPSFKGVLRRGLSREPMQTDEHDVLPSLIKKYGAVVAHKPIDVVGVGYWTDAASLSEAGIPSVLFGACGAGAHANEEWVDLHSVQQCADIYARVIAEFCR